MNDLGLSHCFEDIFYSAVLGVLKPSPEYFRRIELKLNLPAGQKPLFFDDTLAVVSAANAYSWEGIEYLNIQDLTKSAFIRKALQQSSFGEL